jgi:phosphatidylglycerophosphate synthase
MRKIPHELECPVDNVLIDLCEPLSIFFRKLDFTPNGITTLSLICGLLAIYFLYKDKPYAAVTFYFISYIFDCLDGYYARKYKMCSKFGDFYDHIKDWIIFTLFFIVFIKRNKNKLSKNEWIAASIVFALLFANQVLYFACQEKYHDKLDNTPTLQWLSTIIKDKETAENYLSYCRHGGIGTFVVIVIIFVLYVELKKK